MTCELSRMTRILIELTVSPTRSARFQTGGEARREVLVEIQRELGFQLRDDEFTALMDTSKDDIEEFSCTQQTFVNVLLVGTDQGVSVNGVVIEPVAKKRRE